MEYSQAFAIAKEWEQQNACGHGAQVARALYRHLAERALKPEEGQACVRCHGEGVVDDGYLTHSEGGFEYSQPIKCVKDCPTCKGRGRASQLALPAGPVPEGALKALELAIEKLEVANRCMTFDDVLPGLKEALAAASPAVAQPVADDSQTGFWKWLDQAYRDGSDGDGFKFTKWNMEAAYRAGMNAAQPVADELIPILREAMIWGRQQNYAPYTGEFGKAADEKAASLATLARAALCQPAEEGVKPHA